MRGLGTVDAQLHAPTGVLGMLLGQEAVEHVPHVAVQLFLDLRELARMASPGAALDHHQHHLVRLRVDGDEVHELRVLDTRLAEFGDHLFAGHTFHGGLLGAR